MARYDGLIIPRSYSDYLNKTDGATLSQMLDSIGGTFDAVPTAGSNKPARSGGIFSANAVIMANGTTLTGVTIASGSIIRVMFTAAITGSDTTTGLSLTYNGTAYPVKVGKQGALASFVASNISDSYIYAQAYTTLELAFDGTQFIIIGNPVVLSSSDYTIYADGNTNYTATKTDSLIIKRIAKQKVDMGQDLTYTCDLSSYEGVGMYLVATTGGYARSTHLFAIINIGTVQQEAIVLSSSSMSVSVLNSIVTITYNFTSPDAEYITVYKLY